MKLQRLQKVWILTFVVGTSNQLFKRDSYIETKYSKKKKIVTGKTPFFVIGLFCTPHSICLSIAGSFA